MLNCLENFFSQLEGFRRLEGDLHLAVGVCKPLDPQPDGPVLEVGPLALLQRLEVLVDDQIQVLSDDLGDRVQLLVVLGPLLSEEVEFGEFLQADAGQVADCNFVLAGELHDFGTQIAVADRAQVFLVGLQVAGVFEHHVGQSRLDLRLHNLPEDRGGLQWQFPHFLVLLLLTLAPAEVLAHQVLQVPALVGTEQRPVPVSQHPLHEQVGDPEALEQVACSLLVLAVVLLEL